MKTVPVASWLVGLSLLAATITAAGERTQSFPAKKGGALEVRTDGGSITVRGWDKEEVFVRVRSLNEDQLKAVSMSEGGGKVSVEFRWNKRSVEDMQFEISVPSSFDTDLKTAGGAVTIEAPLTGNIKGNTAGGDIKLGSLGGVIRMETAGGEISAGEIAGDFTAKTAGGDVEVKGVTGEAEISTAGGNISTGTIGKTIKASSAGGNIAIGKVGGEVNASTAGGNVKLESGQGHVMLNTAGGNIALNSAKGRISVNTAAGNVDVHDVAGSVNARTAAGDLKVTLDPAVNESSSLQTAAGNIVLTLPENARATVVARARGPFTRWGEKGDSQIHSDFPITKSEGRGEGQAEISVNGGGHRISLETMIGTITVRKGK
jgi:hypothetical protein